MLRHPIRPLGGVLRKQPTRCLRPMGVTAP